MTTSANSNGHSETPEQEDTKSVSTTNRAKRQSAKSGGIVKAKGDDSDVILLDYNVRLIPTEYLPNKRPIEASDFEIVATLDSAGQRPIMATSFQISPMDVLPGHRPIEVSTLVISDLHTLPGDRPIARNDVIDPPPPTLMGYLD
ncbi:MAG TPA: hypothetical protein V6D07_03770 [Trichocoleus sp.]